MGACAAAVFAAGPLALTGCRTAAKAVAKPKARFTSLGVAGRLQGAKAAADAGAEHMEMSVRRVLVPDKPESVFKENMAAVKALPIPLIACNSFIPRTIKSVGPDADHDSVLAWAKIAFSRAQRLGVGTIVYGSGGSRGIPDGFGPKVASDQFVELLKRMGPLAQQYGVTVAVEPLQPQEVHFINMVGEGAAIARQVDHPNVKLTVDLFHMLRGNDPAQAIRGAGPLVYHTHIAENKGRSTPGVHGEDFRPMLKALKDIGYVGPMSIEGAWKAQELARGFEVIREQWGSV